MLTHSSSVKSIYHQKLYHPKTDCKNKYIIIIIYIIYICIYLYITILYIVCIPHEISPSCDFVRFFFSIQRCQRPRHSRQKTKVCIACATVASTSASMSLPRRNFKEIPGTSWGSSCVYVGNLYVPWSEHAKMIGEMYWNVIHHHASLEIQVNHGFFLLIKSID
jgi:hypothetical protein